MLYYVPCTMYDLSLRGPRRILIRGEERRTMRSVTGAAEQRLTRALIQARYGPLRLIAKRERSVEQCVVLQELRSSDSHEH